MSMEKEKKIIYADNAATTILDSDAFEAMKPFLLNDYGNASQPYSFARSPKKALVAARTMIAKCINARPDEIYFTSGGTESDNWAIKGIALYGKKEQIITSKIEHHAVLNTCKNIEEFGVPVIYLNVTKDGVIEPDFLKQKINTQTKLVSIMMVNNEIGTIQPISELCEIAHQNNALFHTDAVQAIGHIEIDVKALNVDMLSASAHKFNGPKGVGFLYIKQGTDIKPYFNGGSQQSYLRAGTEDVASIVGMAVALKNNCDMLVENTKHLNLLESRLIERLNNEKIDYIRNGGGNHIPGNLSLSFKNADGEAILHRLDLMGICVSTGAACNTVNTDISHVLKAINLESNYALGTIRISLGKQNTIFEVDAISEAICNIVN